MRWLRATAASTLLGHTATRNMLLVIARPFPFVDCHGTTHPPRAHSPTLSRAPP